MGQKNFTRVLSALAERLGFTVDDVAWSLSWCQGDGCSFTGTFDVQAFIREQLAVDTDEAQRARVLDDRGLTVRVKRRHSHYCHAQTVSIEIDDAAELYTWTDSETAAFIATTEAIEDRAKDLKDEACARMERLGYAFVGACVFDPVEVYREEIGDEAIVVRVVHSEIGTDLFPDQGEYSDDDEEDIDQAIALLEELDRTPSGTFLIGHLDLIHVDADGDEMKVEKRFGGIYDRRDGTEQFIEVFEEIDALRKDITGRQAQHTHPEPLPMAA